MLFCLLVRYLPLVTPMAKDSMYRTVHPYAAKSTREFRSWNMGKQVAAEVCYVARWRLPPMSFRNCLDCHLNSDVLHRSFSVPAPFGDSFKISRPSKLTQSPTDTLYGCSGSTGIRSHFTVSSKF